VSEEYREAFGEHAYDEQGNYIGFDYGDAQFTPETEAQAAWADLLEASHAAPAGSPEAAGVEEVAEGELALPVGEGSEDSADAVQDDHVQDAVQDAGADAQPVAAASEPAEAAALPEAPGVS
jgi:hypothetical protein